MMPISKKSFSQDEHGKRLCSLFALLVLVHFVDNDSAQQSAAKSSGGITCLRPLHGKENNAGGNRRSAKISVKHRITSLGTCTDDGKDPNGRTAEQLEF